MATYVLVPGAGGSPWDWHLVAAELRERGHAVVSVDLPCEDGSAGLWRYADAVVATIGDRTDLVVVGHSFAGFTVPLVCGRVPVDLVVLVAAMVPAPGETGGDWWANTGQPEAQRAQADRDGRPAAGGVEEIFLHDVPAQLAAEALLRQREQAGTPFEEPWPLPGWPQVPTRFLLCRDDRLFPAGFQRRVVSERLGIVADEIDGGHYVALVRPVELADRLESYTFARFRTMSTAAHPQ